MANANAGSVATVTVTLSAGFVVLFVGLQGASIISVVVNSTPSTTLNPDAYRSISSCGVYSGTLPAGGGTTVTVTGTSAAFGDCNIGAWSLSTSAVLTSTCIAGSGQQNPSFSPNVNAGDYIFGGCFSPAAAANYNASTQVPNNAGPGSPYEVLGVNGNRTDFADWTVIASGAFTVSSSQNNGPTFADYTPTGAGPILFAQACL